MKYTVEVRGRTVEVEIYPDRIFVDGRLVDARLDGERASAIRRLVRGASGTLVVTQPGDGSRSWHLDVQGARLEAHVLTARDLAVRSATRSSRSASGGPLRAPMPGLVVRVLAQEGAAVTPGQGLLVLEAMKMENELKATGAGVVKKLHVKQGDRVEKGAVLLELEG